MREVNDDGIRKITQWEGKVVDKNGFHRPYDDRTGQIVTRGKNYTGFLTLGYGHALTKEELMSDTIIVNDVLYYYWSGISEAIARRIFANDLRFAEMAVNSSVIVPLTDIQFSVLVSFTYNVGVTSFKHSTLLRKLNNGNYKEIPHQLRRWNRSGGVIVEGLINRRNNEVKYWNTSETI